MTRLDHDRRKDIQLVAKLLSDGQYDYNQSKHLIAQARKRAGLTSSSRRKGSVARLTDDEVEALLKTAYTTSSHHGLMVRTLFETGSRVSAFCRMKAEDIDLEQHEIRVVDKGNSIGSGGGLT